MTYAAATARMDRLTRQVEAAADHLAAYDASVVRRVGENLADFQDAAHANDGRSMAEWAGVFSVNVEELLGLIERITRP